MRRDDGFTLIETLVALAVLATGAVALLGVVEDHTGRIAGLEDRVTLRWVAENRLAARHLGLEGQPAWDAGFGRRAAVTEAERTLTDAGLTERIVTVEGARGGVVLRGYTW